MDDGGINLSKFNQSLTLQFFLSGSGSANKMNVDPQPCLLCCLTLLPCGFSTASRLTMLVSGGHTHYTLCGLTLLPCGFSTASSLTMLVSGGHTHCTLCCLTLLPCGFSTASRLTMLVSGGLSGCTTPRCFSDNRGLAQPTGLLLGATFSLQRGGGGGRGRMFPRLFDFGRFSARLQHLAT